MTNPSTGEVFAVAPHADAAMCDDAVESAIAAGPAWAATPIEERRAKMTEAMEILKAHEQELAELLVKEQGKPLAMALAECGMCWDQMQKIIDTELPVEVYSEDEDFKTVAVRKPIGVVAGITPWNFPMFTSIQKWTPSLTFGNTFVHKPSPYTPVTGVRVAELIKDVFPPGVFNFVSGNDSEGHNVGTHLVNHEGVRKVSFTGSVATGKKIMAASANDVKRVTLELGGNDPAIIRGDVDVKEVAPEVFSGAFSNTGQICCAIKRAFVHESIYDEFVEEITKSAQAAKMGDGFAEDTEFGPLNNSMQFEKVQGERPTEISSLPSGLCGLPVLRDERADRHRRGRSRAGRHNRHRRKGHGWRWQGLFLRADDHLRREGGRTHRGRGAVRPGAPNHQVQRRRGGARPR